MKIIYIHQYFTIPTMGGGTRSYDLAKKFLEAGHEVEFITSANNFSEKFKNRWNLMEIEGIKLHVLKISQYSSSMSPIQRIKVFFEFIWYACFKVLSLKGDVVLATSTPLTVGIPAMVKRWFHKTPYIFEARDVWPEAVIAIGAVKNKFSIRILYALESLIYKNASALVPLSTDMKCSIVTRYINLKSPMEVIENIAELNRFRNGFVSHESVVDRKLGFKPRFSILYAGTFGKVNGLKYAIELAAKLLPIDPTIVFLLMGGGAEKNDIIELAKIRNVYNKNVYFLEPVSKNQLPQYYHEAQMGSSFVIPIKELWANSANKFFDTLAASRPMLINHEGWQKEILLKNDAGFVLPYDPNKIDETCLNRFVSYTKTAETQKRQQQNAIRLAQQFSLENATKKYLKLFQNVLEEETNSQLKT